MSLENSPSMNSYDQGLPDRLPDSPKKKRRFTRTVIYSLCAIVLLLGITNLWVAGSDAVSADTGSVSGTILDEWDRPVEAEIAIVGHDGLAHTDENGHFTMSGIAVGEQTVFITYMLIGVEHHTTVEAGQVADLGVITVDTRLRADYPVDRVDWHQ